MLDALLAMERNPLALYQPRPGQEEFHRSQARHRLMRGPNQLAGKSYTGAAEDAYWLTHTHPWRDIPRRPLRGAFIPYSDKTAKVVEGYLAAFIPKRLWHKDCRYHPDSGFLTRSRRVLRLKTGDSLIIVTQSAGILAIAGHALDFVHYDEPPPPDVYAEARARTVATDGVTWGTLTPIGRPVEHIKKDVDIGIIEEVHIRPTPENTGKTPEELERIEHETLPAERPQRFWGEWEGVTPDRYYAAWSDDFISDELPGGNYWVGVGVDHGEGALRQFAGLALVGNGIVALWDEDESSGKTDSARDARALVDMLARSDLNPEGVDECRGDHNTAGKALSGVMANKLLEHEIAKLLGYPTSQPPMRVRNASKGPGSVAAGCGVLHRAMARGQLLVHPRCKRTIEHFRHWKGPKDGSKGNKEMSHSGDGWRYIVWEKRDDLDQFHRGQSLRVR